MNKITYKIFLLFLFSILLPIISFADDFIEEIENDHFLETTTEITKEPSVSSNNAIVIDRKTQTVLYEKSAYQKVAMASTTKIMTCIIALENSNLNDIVTISKEADSIHGSTVGIKANTKISMQDLLYGLMLRSGNDCAIAIAEHISGNVEKFANLMNEKASSLGLTNTHFVTPHGLDDDNHYTTAYELAILTNYALKNPVFRKIVSTKNYTMSISGEQKQLSNTNELLGNLNGVYGVKTGFTFNAGRCLVSCAKRNELDIIVVVLGANTKKIRTIDSRNLIEYSFNKFHYFDTYTIIEKNFMEYKKYFENNYVLEKTTDIPIISIQNPSIYEYPLSQEEIFNLHTKIYTFTKFSPDISKGNKIGTITLYTVNKILYSLDIILENNLKKNTSIFYCKNILKNYFKSILFT